MSKLLGVLNDKERDIIRETETARLEKLDEDQVIDLHSRIRRARNKHQKNYRRRASAGVSDHGGRGKSRPKNTRAAQKAEVFEDALATVSARLEVLARQSADHLKRERLAAASAGRSPGPQAQDESDAQTGTVGPGVQRKHRTTTGATKRKASTRAAGARRQAKRDSR